MREPDDAATHHLISSKLREQDKDTAEEDEAKVVERMALVADHEAARVAQPGEEPCHHPAFGYVRDACTVAANASALV
jgi:hypothetical protein